MNYETRFQPVLPRNEFLKRVALHFAVGSALIAGSLAIGMIGYHGLEHLSWLDAFLNATMLLGGMGPVNTPTSSAGKLFAGCYALYSGLIFLVAVAIVLAPAFHRIMHKLHWDEEAQA